MEVLLESSRDLEDSIAKKRSRGVELGAGEHLYFTAYWKYQTALNNADNWEPPRTKLCRVGSNGLRAAGVRPGAFVYVLTVNDGQAILLGRIQVDKIVSYREATVLFGTGLWEAEDWCIASPERSADFSLNRVVPTLMAQSLRFVRAGGRIEPLKFRKVEPEKLDGQTLRSVGKLTTDSALLLDQLIDDEGSAVEELGSGAEVALSPTFHEGISVSVTLTRFERDPHAREACIACHGVRCCVCGFDFQKVYGEIGAGFVHIHHLSPLATVGEGHEVDPVNDLRPICPNCHAMVHRREPCLTIEQLKYLMDQMCS